MTSDERKLVVWHGASLATNSYMGPDPNPADKDSECLLIITAEPERMKIYSDMIIPKHMVRKEMPEHILQDKTKGAIIYSPGD